MPALGLMTNMANSFGRARPLVGASYVTSVMEYTRVPLGLFSHKRKKRNKKKIEKYSKLQIKVCNSQLIAYVTFSQNHIAYVICTTLLFFFPMTFTFYCHLKMFLTNENYSWILFHCVISLLFPAWLRLKY